MIRKCINKGFNYRNLSTNFIDSLCTDKNCFNHNSKYIRSIKITFNNPVHKMNQHSIFRDSTYNADINLSDDNINMYKCLSSDNLDDLLHKIKIFLNNEIKL